MFRFCGERGLPVTVHIDYEFDTGRKYPRPNWWYGGGIEAYERAVCACPETKFISHAPGFWAPISNDAQFGRVRAEMPDGACYGAFGSDRFPVTDSIEILQTLVLSRAVGLKSQVLPEY